MKLKVQLEVYVLESRPLYSAQPAILFKMLEPTLLLEDKGFSKTCKLSGMELPEGTYLLLGPSRSGKTRLAKQMLWCSLIKGSSVIYVCVDESPDELVESIQSMGFDLYPFFKARRLGIIDASELRSGLKHRGESSKMDLRDLKNIRKTLEKTVNRLENRRVKLILDSLSTIDMKFGYEVTSQLLMAIQSIGVEVALFTYGYYDPLDESYRRYASMCNGVLELRTEQLFHGRFLRSFRLSLENPGSSTWLLYQMQSTGIACIAWGDPQDCDLCSIQKLLRTISHTSRIVK